MCVYVGSRSRVWVFAPCHFIGVWQSHTKVNPGLNYQASLLDFVFSVPTALWLLVIFLFV